MSEYERKVLAYLDFFAEVIEGAVSTSDARANIHDFNVWLKPRYEKLRQELSAAEQT